MNREMTIWSIVFLLGALGLLWRVGTAPNGVGAVYVIAKPPAGEPAADAPAKPVRYRETGRETPGALLSWERTIGVWIAALLTLGVFSYLYRDNPAYKLVESVVVGVSAGYSFVVGFWEVLVDKLLLKLTPAVVNAWSKPLAEGEAGDPRDWWALVPLILGVMIFFRFVPKMEWLSVWPLAFVVGTTAGLKLIVFLEADFIGQIRNTMMPLIVFAADQQNGATLDISRSIKNTLLVLGVLASLTYFYFSVEHKGVIRQVARCGIWVLMITFGSSFAFTVMGRITLLTVRLEFLLGRWLGFIDVPR
jgi:hypothetical protein